MPQPQQQPTAYDILGRPLVNKGINYGINRGIQYGWQNWGKPAWDSTFGAGATAATPAAEGAGQGALSGLGGTGLSDYTSAAVPALQVAAPLIMAYLKYQAGSGRNEPLEKRRDTQLRGRLLSDQLSGKAIDQEQVENQYGVKPKYLSTGISGVDQENYNQAIDPRGWTSQDLYNDMMGESSQYYQTGGVGNSGYTGNQINDLFGSQKGKLAESMGLPGLLDWSQHDQGSGFNQNYLQNDPTGKAYAANEQERVLGPSKKFEGLEDTDKQMYRQWANLANGGGGGDDSQAIQQYMDAQTIKELNDKYKMNLQNYGERMTARNQRG